MADRSHSTSAAHLAVWALSVPLALACRTKYTPTAAILLTSAAFTAVQTAPQPWYCVPSMHTQVRCDGE